jgi:hypothetical protein
MTYVTWRGDEQRIGWVIVHGFAFLFLAGYAGFCGAVICVLSVGGAFLFRRRRPTAVDSLLIAGLVVLCVPLIIPQQSWPRLAGWVFGPPPLTAWRLFRAVHDHDAQTLQGLLSRGMKLNTLDEGGCSLLFSAVDSRAPELVRLLLSKGMDVNGRSCKGQTALFRAALYRDVPMIHLLLDAGADPSVRDEAGKTALDIVTTLPPNGDREREETIKLLSTPVPH